eukprot:CAMPEP_0118989822 /NCGR_PEP_ID=MMETSP1173-20130426/48716_1 /TAXON_ID=1034831 /ORGANISM="Rhizochromulina marina cf, Strain CCMP1243" /LENGTH=62 /DNA_ID=CAMNT_0006940831 /DNA_START=46 /DNA_END=231 /DNA_ORIENTATION=+
MSPRPIAGDRRDATLRGISDMETGRFRVSSAMLPGQKQLEPAEKGQVARRSTTHEPRDSSAA